MHADLVGTAGFQAALQRGVRTEALAQAVMGDRFLAVLAHRHLQAVARVAVDRGIGGTAGHQRAHHDGQVLAMHVACGQLFDQRGLRFQGLGHHHHAAGVLVQAVHDASARQHRHRRIAEQQGVDQSAAMVAGTRVHHQAHRLVDHQQVLVLEQHVQRDVLRLGVGLGLEHHVEGHDLAAAQRIARAHLGAVQQDVARLDPLGQARTRVFGEQFGHHGVETTAGGGVGDDGLAGRFRGLFRHGRGDSLKFWGPGGRFQSLDRTLGYHRPFVFQPRPASTS